MGIARIEGAKGARPSWDLGQVGEMEEVYEAEEEDYLDGGRVAGVVGG